MAPHSSTLAWKIPWMEEPGGLQSMGFAKSRTRLSDFTFSFHFHALEKKMATHLSILKNPMDRGVWRVTVHGVTKNRIQLNDGEGNGNPLQCSCLENPREGGAWWAAVCGVAQSRTRLK